MKIRIEYWKGSREFLSPFKWRVGFLLPSIHWGVPYLDRWQSSPQRWMGGEGCHLAPHLLKSLERLSRFSLNVIFGWQGWQHGSFALVGKIPYTRSCHLLLFLRHLYSFCHRLIFACLNWHFHFTPLMFNFYLPKNFYPKEKTSQANIS